MVVGCHVVEEEMLFAEVVGLSFTDLVLVTRSEAVILAGNTEFLECFTHFLFKLKSFFFIHGWR